MSLKMVLDTLDRALTRVVNELIVILFLLMLGIASAQVALRYFFGTGIMWGDPAARTLVLWTGFLGAILAIGDNQHFHLDILTRFLPGSVRKWLIQMSNLFGAAICFLLARAGTSFLGFESETTTFLNLPLVVVDSIIPFGFYIMMVRFAVRAVVGPGSPVSQEPEQIRKGGEDTWSSS
jgi:TRAP-type C4-dicarboxylate transport system permease small subunit